MKLSRSNLGGNGSPKPNLPQYSSYVQYSEFENLLRALTIKTHDFTEQIKSFKLSQSFESQFDKYKTLISFLNTLQEKQRLIGSSGKNNSNNNIQRDLLNKIFINRVPPPPKENDGGNRVKGGMKFKNFEWYKDCLSLFTQDLQERNEGLSREDRKIIDGGGEIWGEEEASNSVEKQNEIHRMIVKNWEVLMKSFGVECPEVDVYFDKDFESGKKKKKMTRKSMKRKKKKKRKRRGKQKYGDDDEEDDDEEEEVEGEDEEIDSKRKQFYSDSNVNRVKKMDKNFIKFFSPVSKYGKSKSIKDLPNMTKNNVDDFPLEKSKPIVISTSFFPKKRSQRRLDGTNIKQPPTSKQTVSNILRNNKDLTKEQKKLLFKKHLIKEKKKMQLLRMKQKLSTKGIDFDKDPEKMLRNLKRVSLKKRRSYKTADFLEMKMVGVRRRGRGMMTAITPSMTQKVQFKATKRKMSTLPSSRRKRVKRMRTTNQPNQRNRIQ